MALLTNLKVKKIMEDKGVSRKQLASDLKMHECSLSYLLNNDIFERPRKIADALGVELKDLIDE